MRFRHLGGFCELQAGDDVPNKLFEAMPANLKKNVTGNAEKAQVQQKEEKAAEVAKS